MRLSTVIKSSLCVMMQCYAFRLQSLRSELTKLLPLGRHLETHADLRNLVIYPRNLLPFHLIQGLLKITLRQNIQRFLKDCIQASVYDGKFSEITNKMRSFQFAFIKIASSFNMNNMITFNDVGFKWKTLPQY